MQLMRYSCAVTMDAIAACSAQNPVPEPVSMQTPPNSLPASVTRTAVTSPKSRSPTLCGFNNTAARCTRSAFRKSGDMLGAYPAPRHGIDDRSAIPLGRHSRRPGSAYGTCPDRPSAGWVGCPGTDLESLPLTGDEMNDQQGTCLHRAL